MPAHSPSSPAPLRLSRIVSDMTGCSRREAELFIAGGWVRIDGRVAELPGEMALPAAVTLDADARAEPVPDVTLLLHKPPGFTTWPDGRQPALQLLVPARLAEGDRSGRQPVRRHFREQECLTDLEVAASGLVLYSQEFRVRRKLTEDAALIEHEVLVEVAGPVEARQLEALNRAPVVDGRAMAPARVSVGQRREGVTVLRFASKGHRVGRIAQVLESVGLGVSGMRRVRVGRVSLAGLGVGEWRYLGAAERV